MSDKLVELEVDLEEGLMRAVTVAYLKKEYEKAKEEKDTEITLAYETVLEELMYPEDNYKF